MPDILGTRLKVGSLVPSINSSVEPEVASMGVPGVTHMASRIALPNQHFSSDADSKAIVEATQHDLLPALDRLMSCNPDRVIMAMAAPCFWGGMAGCQAMQKKLDDRARVPVLLPPDAVAQALRCFDVQRIGVVSPYMPLADRYVEQWFEESGFKATVRGLRAPVEDQIINITPEELYNGLAQVDGPQIQALVHVGTTLAMARLVDDFERRFNKPVISVNVACWWSTLRAAGIEDRLNTFGRLFREF